MAVNVIIDSWLSNLGGVTNVTKFLFAPFRDTNTKNRTLQLWPQNVIIGLQCCNFQNTEGTPTDINFILNNDSKILTFSLTYNDNFISGEIHSNGCTKTSPNSVNLLIGFEVVNNVTIITCVTNNDKPIVLQFSIEDFASLNISFVELRDLLQFSESTICESVNSTLKNLLKQNNIELDVRVFVQTDNYGLNLGELGGYVISDKPYPNGYPKELIGKCENAQFVTNLGIQTFYSFKPKLNKVLKGQGSTLLAQTDDINSIYDADPSDCNFFQNILFYSALRYMLAGLSTDGDFSCRWLYANNYAKFLKNLENSEFRVFLPIFNEKQDCFDFTNFNQYFRSCEHKK